MKKILLPAALIAIASFCACKKKETVPENSAPVMFVNGCAGTLPAIDAKVDEVNVSGALNMPYTNGSGYKNVKAGAAVKISYYITNAGTPVVNGTYNITTGKYYSAFAAGLITSPSLVVTQDDMTAPTASSAKIRFINLSPDIMNVTANVSNNIIDTAVIYKEVTGFLNVTAGTYDLKAGDPTNINTVKALDAKTLAAGKIYTLMLSGTQAGTGESALRLTLISHN